MFEGCSRCGTSLSKVSFATDGQDGNGLQQLGTDWSKRKKSVVFRETNFPFIITI